MGEQEQPSRSRRAVGLFRAAETCRRSHRSAVVFVGVVSGSLEAWLALVYHGFTTPSSLLLTLGRLVVAAIPLCACVVATTLAARSHRGTGRYVVAVLLAWSLSPITCWLYMTAFMPDGSLYKHAELGYYLYFLGRRVGFAAIGGIVVFGLAKVGWIALTAILARPAGTCTSCGYPRDGLPSPRCPECGASEERDRKKLESRLSAWLTSFRWLWRAGTVGVVAVGLLLVYSRFYLLSPSAGPPKPASVTNPPGPAGSPP